MMGVCKNNQFLFFFFFCKNAGQKHTYSIVVSHPVMQNGFPIGGFGKKIKLIGVVSQILAFSIIL